MLAHLHGSHLIRFNEVRPRVVFDGSQACVVIECRVRKQGLCRLGVALLGQCLVRVFVLVSDSWYEHLCACVLVCWYGYGSWFW